MDEIKLLTGTSVAYAAKQLFGPSLKMYGEQLRDWQKSRQKRFTEIVKIAGRKLDDKGGVVTERVVLKIMEEGTLSDDALLLNYYGGVLASSRSKVARDDRGAYWSNLVSSLSAYQARLHYLIYSTLAELLQQKEVFSLGLDKNRQEKCQLYLDLPALLTGMEFSGDEDVIALTRHSITGLIAKELLDNYWHRGTGDYLANETGKNIPADGIIITPSLLGFELFMWVIGKGQEPPENIFQANFSYEKISSVSYEGTAELISDLPSK